MINICFKCFSWFSNFLAKSFKDAKFSKGKIFSSQGNALFSRTGASSSFYWKNVKFTFPYAQNSQLFSQMKIWKVKNQNMKMRKEQKRRFERGAKNWHYGTGWLVNGGMLWIDRVYVPPFFSKITNPLNTLRENGGKHSFKLRPSLVSMMLTSFLTKSRFWTLRFFPRLCPFVYLNLFRTFHRLNSNFFSKNFEIFSKSATVWQRPQHSVLDGLTAIWIVRPAPRLWKNTSNTVSDKKTIRNLFFTNLIMAHYIGAVFFERMHELAA